MKFRALFLLILLILPIPCLHAEWAWIEGEQAAFTNIRPHPWYAGQVRKDLLSGSDFLAHFDAGKKGEATYRFRVEHGGPFHFWVRANPVQSSLKYSLNGASPVAICMESPVGGAVNLASDGKPDLRFIGWLDAGSVDLKAGENVLAFTLDSPNSNHGAIDCFVLSNEPFVPSGILKPDQVAQAARQLAEANKGWVAWNPPADDFHDSPIDLRRLNEKFAGEKGRIVARGDGFVHESDGQSVRFWAVNGTGASDPAGLARAARMLAKYGVNLVRQHGTVFDEKTGEWNPAIAQKRGEAVDALKKEGIYSLLSIYFPLWMKPEPGPGWREGYDGRKHLFGLLYFEPEFQKLYRGWLKELLATSTPSGVRLVDEPAVMGIELINEDSLFFWTFNYANVPDPQMQKLEKRFGEWAAGRYGSIAAALQAWGLKHKRDDAAAGRLGFRALHEMISQRTLRDQDTAAFLFDVQASFYRETVAYLRRLGFKGLITASNWTTADNAVLGPLEKLSYMAGDFIDRHGYFGSNQKGADSAWSIRNGHTYSDVSALRFDPQTPGKPKEFSNPVMDATFNSRPSMISETTWSRPNRHRGEAPVVLSVYGALQGSDGIVHFAFDSPRWEVKPSYFMQPWTLTAPTQLGEFPATALIYREGLVRQGEVVADLPVKINDALALKGANFLRDADLDELRKKDVEGGGKSGEREALDPLASFVGRVNIRLDEAGGSPRIADLSACIDRGGQVVTSSTGELRLDYGKGVLTVNAPAAQGVSGDLRSAGAVRLRDIGVESPLEVGHILVVSLDGKPLSESSRMLVQAMSEEKPSGFSAAEESPGVFKISDIGRDPWLIRELAGTIRFFRKDASQLKVTALDLNGYPVKDAGDASSFHLLPGTAYYLVSK